MRSKFPFLRSLVLTVFLAWPALVVTAPPLQAQTRANVQIRIYDRDHRDYHYWDEREDRAYRNYWVERRREHRPYERIKRKEQREYWRWRHEHPDRDDRR